MGGRPGEEPRKLADGRETAGRDIDEDTAAAEAELAQREEQAAQLRGKAVELFKSILSSDKKHDLKAVLDRGKYAMGDYQEINARLLSDFGIDKNIIMGLQDYLKVKPDGKVGIKTIAAISKRFDLNIKIERGERSPEAVSVKEKARKFIDELELWKDGHVEFVGVDEENSDQFRVKLKDKAEDLLPYLKDEMYFTDFDNPEAVKVFSEGLASAKSEADELWAEIMADVKRIREEEQEGQPQA